MIILKVRIGNNLLRNMMHVLLPRATTCMRCIWIRMIKQVRAFLTCPFGASTSMACLVISHGAYGDVILLKIQVTLLLCRWLSGYRQKNN
jgi:hypothetical protein